MADAVRHWVTVPAARVRVRAAENVVAARGQSVEAVLDARDGGLALHALTTVVPTCQRWPAAFGDDGHADVDGVVLCLPEVAA